MKLREYYQYLNGKSLIQNTNDSAFLNYYNSHLSQFKELEKTYMTFMHGNLKLFNCSFSDIDTIVASCVFENLPNWNRITKIYELEYSLDNFAKISTETFGVTETETILGAITKDRTEKGFNFPNDLSSKTQTAENEINDTTQKHTNNTKVDEHINTLKIDNKNTHDIQKSIEMEFNIAMFNFYASVLMTIIQNITLPIFEEVDA